jgi:hypothetical protein
VAASNAPKSRKNGSRRPRHVMASRARQSQPPSPAAAGEDTAPVKAERSRCSAPRHVLSHEKAAHTRMGMAGCTAEGRKKSCGGAPG